MIYKILSSDSGPDNVKQKKILFNPVMSYLYKEDLIFK